MAGYLVVLILGMLIPFALTAWKPKTVAKLIWSAAYTAEDFRAHYRGCAKELGRRKEDRQGNTVSKFAGDVVSGLVNMGVGRKKAERVVEQLEREKMYDGFEEMFKDAVQIARKTAVTA